MLTAEVLQLNSTPLTNLRFLEYSIPCNNVLDTLQFFQQLGFTALPTNDVLDYPYAVITDGRCYLGLHEQQYFEQLSEQPRLSFVHEELVPLTQHLHENDFKVMHSELAEDKFHQALVKGPNQAVLHILAARSFSPPPSDAYKNSVLGYFRGIVLPTSNLKRSSDFWQNFGLLVMETENANCVSVSANRLNMLLLDETSHDMPGFLFEHPEPETLFPHFARYGITLDVGEQNLVLDSEYLLKAPNGLHLWVKRES